MANVSSLIPSHAWLSRYERSWLSRDILGGLAAGAVVVPQAMGYATIAELPVEVGLYTCMVPMVVYAVLGGSRTLSVSTTSTVAMLTASTLIAAGVAAAGGDPARDLATLTMLVGVILLVARVLRLGNVVDNISLATLTGIKTGVGLTVAAIELPKLLGIPGDPTAGNFFAALGAVLDDLDDASVVTVVFSVATVALLLGLARVAPRVPAPLVAVALGIALVEWGDLDEHGVAVIAPVPRGLPLPVAPSLDHFGALVPGAFAIAIMCFLETVSVARSVRRPDEPSIDNDQELVANGLSCIGGAFFRAMPSAGGFSQTAINQTAGARTQVSELVTAALAVASALFLGPVLSDLPEATLGALVIVAVLGLIKPSEFARFWHVSRLEFAVAVVTATAGLCFGLLVAVLVGVLLTLLLVLYELDHVGVTELQATFAHDDVRLPDDGTARVPGLLVLRVDGPLYTANVRSVNRRIIAAVGAAPSISVVVLDLSAVAMLSVTVIDEMANLGHELAGRGTSLWAAGLPPRAVATARRTDGWRELADTGRLHPTSLAAVHAFTAAANS